MELLAIGMPGAQELLVILLIVLVLFGAKKLPELAKGLGQGMNELKKARDDFSKEASEVKAVASSPSETPSETPYDLDPAPVASDKHSA